MVVPTRKEDNQSPVEPANADATRVASELAPFIGNFHKTLPHNKFGEVNPADYRRLEKISIQVEAGAQLNFESVAAGPLVPTPDLPQTPFVLGMAPTQEQIALTKSAARLASPLAGASTETLGPDPRSLTMLPPPSVRSLTASAEIAELYWMALLRDAPMLAFQEQKDPARPGSACADLADHKSQLGYDVVERTNAAQLALSRMFKIALQHDSEMGKLREGLDVAAGPVTLQSLFRCGLHDEEFGPLISQFFLRPIPFGVQTIDPRQVPYAAKTDFLTSHGDWLLAQNTGKDKFGRDYGSCNNYADQLHRGARYYPANNPVRFISTLRDMARFVNRDALHQAYFNAALFLLSIDAPLDEGNPYRAPFARQGAFATLGGPDLLTLVSEVSTRALKAAWRQKWLVHRRCRPEVMGGLIQMQRKGLGVPGERRAYGLPTDVPGLPEFRVALDETLGAVEVHNAVLNGGPGKGTLFLPLAFSAGSPTHPSYGAGHAAVAGACVTVLKAWFDEDVPLKNIFDTFNHNQATARVGALEPTARPAKLLQPGYRKAGKDLEEFCEPQQYTRSDAQKMTVGGELNKLASNVAMGRSMGGVHWRTDNTRSLRLGEEVAIEILRKRSAEYAERPQSFTFRSFDRQLIRIADGKVKR